jgi:hypothetical protein
VQDKWVRWILFGLLAQVRQSQVAGTIKDSSGATIPGTFGSLMGGSPKGPGSRQFDFIVNKRFRVTETLNVQFRAEFFNIFNLTNFSNPPATLPNVLGAGTNKL